MCFRDLSALETARDDQPAGGGLDLDPRTGVDRREARAAAVDLRRAEPVDPCRADLRAVHEEVDALARELPDVLDLDLQLALALDLRLRGIISVRFISSSFVDLASRLGGPGLRAGQAKAKLRFSEVLVGT